MAREFSRELTALVLDQPTRGLDVGSIEFIHRQVIAKRDDGAAILLVSAELDEVMELSDRIAVMYRGEIVALVDGPTAQREEIGLLMATGRRDPEAQAAASTSMTPRRRSRPSRSSVHGRRRPRYRRARRRPRPDGPPTCADRPRRRGLPRGGGADGPAPDDAEPER